MLAREYVFWDIFMGYLWNQLSQLLPWTPSSTTGYLDYPDIYIIRKMLKTLDDQTCWSVCPGESIKFLLTQEWGMIFRLLSEAFVIPKVFSLAPSHFGVRGNNYLLSSESLPSRTQKIRKLKIWQSHGRSSQNMQSWAFDECQKTKGQMIINSNIWKTNKTEAKNVFKILKEKRKLPLEVREQAQGKPE